MRRRPVPVRVRETWAGRGAAEIAGMASTVSSTVLEDRREKDHTQASGPHGGMLRRGAKAERGP